MSHRRVIEYPTFNATHFQVGCHYCFFDLTGNIPNYKRILNPYCPLFTLFIYLCLSIFSLCSMLLINLSNLSMTSKSTKAPSKNKIYKGSAISSSSEPNLRDIAQLFSLKPHDYDESVRVMIKFITRHPIAVPLTKTLNPNFLLCLSHKTFKIIKVSNDVLQCLITDDMIIPITNETFLKAIGVYPNPEGFQEFGLTL